MIIQKERYHKRQRQCKPLKSIDSYGEPVLMNYDSQHTYTTALGGLCTIVHAIFVMIITVVAVKRLVTKDNPNITSYNENQNYLDED